LRIPVGARVEHALMSAIASGSVSTSGGRRRGLNDADAEVDELAAGRGSAAAIRDWVTFLSTNVIISLSPDGSAVVLRVGVATAQECL